MERNEFRGQKSEIRFTFGRMGRCNAEANIGSLICDVLDYCTVGVATA